MRIISGISGRFTVGGTVHRSARRLPLKIDLNPPDDLRMAKYEETNRTLPALIGSIKPASVTCIGMASAGSGMGLLDLVPLATAHVGTSARCSRSGIDH